MGSCDLSNHVTERREIVVILSSQRPAWRMPIEWPCGMSPNGCLWSIVAVDVRLQRSSGATNVALKNHDNGWTQRTMVNH
jgi:hypothetical protein